MRLEEIFESSWASLERHGRSKRAHVYKNGSSGEKEFVDGDTYSDNVSKRRGPSTYKVPTGKAADDERKRKARELQAELKARKTAKMSAKAE